MAGALTASLSAFEGIGTIVAIESSMRSPRKIFPRLMGCAIALVLVILCGFGTACYGYFGAETKQAITLNLSRGSNLVLTLWSFILVSILLTFPLQAFPIFLAVEDVWTIDHRILFLLRRAAITACCTGDAAAAAAADGGGCGGGDGIAVECCVVHHYLLFTTHVTSCALMSPLRCCLSRSEFICVRAAAPNFNTDFMFYPKTLLQVCGRNQWLHRLRLAALRHPMRNRPETERARNGCSSPTHCVFAPFFTSCLQGSLLWWRCVVVALLGIGGGVFSLKLAIQNIAGK